MNGLFIRRFLTMLRLHTGRDLHDGSAGCLLAEYPRIAPACARRLNLTARLQFAAGERPIYVCDSCASLLTNNWKGTVLGTMRAIQPSFAPKGDAPRTQSQARLSEELHTFDDSLGGRFDEIQSEYDRFLALRDVAFGATALSLDGKHTNTVGLQKILIRHAAELEARLGPHYDDFEQAVFRHYSRVQLPDDAGAYRGGE